MRSRQFPYNANKIPLAEQATQAICGHNGSGASRLERMRVRCARGPGRQQCPTGSRGSPGSATRRSGPGARLPSTPRPGRRATFGCEFGQLVRRSRAPGDHLRRRSPSDSGRTRRISLALEGVFREEGIGPRARRQSGAGFRAGGPHRLRLRAEKELRGSAPHVATGRRTNTGEVGSEPPRGIALDKKGSSSRTTSTAPARPGRMTGATSSESQEFRTPPGTITASASTC